MILVRPGLGKRLRDTGKTRQIAAVREWEANQSRPAQRQPEQMYGHDSADEQPSDKQTDKHASSNGQRKSKITGKKKYSSRKAWMAKLYDYNYDWSQPEYIQAHNIKPLGFFRKPFGCRLSVKECWKLGMGPGIQPVHEERWRRVLQSIEKAHLASHPHYHRADGVLVPVDIPRPGYRHSSRG